MENIRIFNDDTELCNKIIKHIIDYNEINNESIKNKIIIHNFTIVNIFDFFVKLPFDEKKVIFENYNLCDAILEIEKLRKIDSKKL